MSNQHPVGCEGCLCVKDNYFEFGDKIKRNCPYHGQHWVFTRKAEELFINMNKVVEEVYELVNTVHQLRSYKYEREAAVGARDKTEELLGLLNDLLIEIEAE